MNNIEVNHPTIVPREEWIAARQRLLVQEKESTRLHDEVSRQRRELPWVKVEKSYLFDGPDGKVTLADLFEGRSQLLVYHFMFGPGWGEGCGGCSFLCDHVDAARQHFEHHDNSFAAVSRAPWAEIVPFKKRMGWQFTWVSSSGSDFNYDFQATATPEESAKKEMFYNFKMTRIEGEEQPGGSVFYKDEHGEIFHTYSFYERGGEELLGAYHFIDLTPKAVWRPARFPGSDITTDMIEAASKSQSPFCALARP
jgi:predicted dithiol-disulfide oxidoreductase (DUF899 family)